MKLLIVGPQGSGKGTQAEKIVEKYGVKHISTGDIFRYNIKNKTELVVEALKYINDGHLVPDELTNKLVEDTLASEDAFLLDGYPRNLYQAEFLDSITGLDKVILIDVTEEETLKRLSGRYMCKSTGKIYNINTAPKPKKMEFDGNGQFLRAFDDETGEELYQRDDDKPEAIKKRLEIYFKETAPIVDYYEKQGIVVKIDGAQTIDKVTADIYKALDN